MCAYAWIQAKQAQQRSILIIINQLMTLNAIRATPRALDWINTTRSAYLLHIFDQAINLVNQDARVLSIVTPEIGSGPFSLLVGEGGFLSQVTVQSPVSVEEQKITLGGLSIDLRTYELWHPRPEWRPLNANQIRDLSQRIYFELCTTEREQNFPGVLNSLNKVTQPASTYSQAASWAIEQVRIGFQQADQQSMLKGIADLAGLGIGLTPAGDDFLIGMLHGLWASAALKAQPLCKTIAETAIPRTSSLSAAWLEAASQGETTQAWLAFIEAVQAGDEKQTQSALRQIINTGETSGADALSGFYFILKQEQV